MLDRRIVGRNEDRRVARVPHVGTAGGPRRHSDVGETIKLSRWRGKQRESKNRIETLRWMTNMGHATRPSRQP